MLLNWVRETEFPGSGNRSEAEDIFQCHVSVKSSSIIELGTVYLTRYGDVDADARTPVVVG
jgi:hypothetical protein